MASLEKISRISWKQPLKDRNTYDIWSVPKEVAEYCQLINKSNRLLQIEFANNLYPSITGSFRISESKKTIGEKTTSNKEINFREELQEKFKSLSKEQKRNSFFIVTVLDMPTADITELESNVAALLVNPIVVQPLGIIHPKKTDKTVSVFERDPKVIAWTIQNAHGLCECCQEPAFIKGDGAAYLEVHHLRPLAEDGSDTIANTVAVCANCHRKLHFSADKIDIRKELIQKIQRLGDEYV